MANDLVGSPAVLQLVALESVGKATCLQRNRDRKAREKHRSTDRCRPNDSDTPIHPQALRTLGV
jgi:hypothetical protein